MLHAVYFAGDMLSGRGDEGLHLLGAGPWVGDKHIGEGDVDLGFLLTGVINTANRPNNRPVRGQQGVIWLPRNCRARRPARPRGRLRCLCGSWRASNLGRRVAVQAFIHSRCGHWVQGNRVAGARPAKTLTLSAVLDEPRRTQRKSRPWAVIRYTPASSPRWAMAALGTCNCWLWPRLKAILLGCPAPGLSPQWTGLSHQRAGLSRQQAG